MKYRIRKEELAELCDAKDKMCIYCGGKICDNCMVNLLINKAFNEVKED